MTVHFIGAGPGAPDLLTLRAQRLIASSQVCLYAGALVSPEVLEHAPAGARIIDTQHLDLDEIVAELQAAHERDEDVARVHSGDLSIYSATAEQMRRLDGLGIPWDVTPGVPQRLWNFGEKSSMDNPDAISRRPGGPRHDGVPPSSRP